MYLFGISQTTSAGVDARLNRTERRLYDDDGAPDLIRTRTQRFADAMVELLTGTSRTGETPPHPKCSMAATFDVSGINLDDGTPILFDGPANPIWVGRDHRTATIHQWKALIARDRHCIGGGASPDRCHAHHIRYWEHNGPTNIDNLALVCSRCHHDIHIRGHTLHHDNDRWTIRPPGAPPDTGITNFPDSDFPTTPETSHLTLTA
ncbi:MAG: HNH endonuclease signature motif containing protein [Acidimicrobiales bacterium]|jgi:hypothetical protein|nr:HNH endonuclease signature motif containing protein [Acidimicrobiales bacterium]